MPRTPDTQINNQLAAPRIGAYLTADVNTRSARGTRTQSSDDSYPARDPKRLNTEGLLLSDSTPTVGHIDPTTRLDSLGIVEMLWMLLGRTARTMWGEYPHRDDA